MAGGDFATLERQPAVLTLTWATTILEQCKLAQYLGTIDTTEKRRDTLYVQPMNRIPKVWYVLATCSDCHQKVNKNWEH